MKSKLAKNNTPIDWTTERFNSRVTLAYGSSLPESKRLPGAIPVYGSNGVVGRHNEPLIKGPGIIVGRKGTIGAVTWSDTDFWPIDTTYYIEKDDSIDLHWLYFKLQMLGLPKMNSASGTPGLNREEVYKLNLTIPTVSEQKKIAEILGSVDDEITKTEEIISATERLKSGLMRKMFSGNGVNTKLGEIASIVRGGSPRPIEDYITDEPDGLNWLKIGDIEQGAKYITYTSQKIKRAGLKKTTMVHSGDFILSNSMSFGRPYIMKIDACIHDGWLAFKNVKTNLIDSEFLYYLLSSELLQKNFTAVAAGSGVKNLKRESVLNIVVKLPPLEKQKEITRILSSVDDKVTVYKKIRSNLLLLKKGLMQDLLTGKVRTI